MFFADRPRQSPTLNKIPLVRWSRRFAYVNSAHSALPPRLNHAYDGPGGTALSGVLLHSKFLPEIVSRSAVEADRGEHFSRPQDFAGYYEALQAGPDLWCPQSRRLRDWRQLVDLGLMGTGGWAP